MMQNMSRQVDWGYVDKDGNVESGKRVGVTTYGALNTLLGLDTPRSMAITHAIQNGYIMYREDQQGVLKVACLDDAHSREVLAKFLAKPRVAKTPFIELYKSNGRMSARYSISKMDRPTHLLSADNPFEEAIKLLSKGDGPATQFKRPKPFDHFLDEGKGTFVIALPEDHEIEVEFSEDYLRDLPEDCYDDEGNVTGKFSDQHFWEEVQNGMYKLSFVDKQIPESFNCDSGAIALSNVIGEFVQANKPNVLIVDSRADMEKLVHQASDNFVRSNPNYKAHDGGKILITAYSPYADEIVEFIRSSR